MSALSHNNLSVNFPSSVSALRLVPTPPIPDQAARDRFAKRRAAGKIAQALAMAVGRSTAESGTSHLAARLAAEVGALKSFGKPATTVEAKLKPAVVTRSKGSKLLRTVI